MTKRKKGFTIVELVIVIAVIGILAGILIPVFSNLIHDANVASDNYLIRELNNALEINTSETGKTHETIYDALQATDEFGFNVQRINAKARNNKILWDSKNDVFCYLQDGVVEYQNVSIKNADKLSIGDYRLWVCSQTVDNTYSTYLYKYNGDRDIVTTKGLDTSDSTNAGKIDSITYDRHDQTIPANTVAQNVVIRTNSANVSLTVNAPLDVVKHYGSAGDVNIIAVAGSSYHENGSVAFMEVANGRVALEGNSDVAQIHLVATNGDFDNITIAKSENIDMPVFSRDAVEIPAEGKLVVALQEGTANPNAAKDYVWLTAVGIYEQVTVSTSKTNAGTNYAAESNNEERKETAQQIANNITAQVDSREYVLKATTEDNGSTWTYTLESANQEPITTNVTVEVVENVATVSVDSVAKTTTNENGLTEQQKNAIKAEAVYEAVVEEIEENDQYVARIQTTGYASLKAAIDDANENDIINLFKNDTNTQDISVNKVVTINMNGFTFGGKIVVATAANKYVRVNGTANVDAVSRINSYYFPNLYLQRSGTVVLLKDHARGQIYYATYGNNGDYTVDLNGHTLTITENSSEGAIYIGNYYGAADKLTFVNGNVTFTGTSSSANGFHAYGNLVLNNVNVTSACGTAIKGESGYWDGPSNITVTASTINAAQKGIEVISYKSGSTIKQSRLVLTSSDIVASKEAVYLNGSMATITDTSIESTGNKAVSVYASSSASGISPTVTINGNGTIKSGSYNTIDVHAGTLNINGDVEVIGSSTVIYADSSAIMLTNGTYTGRISLGSSGQLTIAGGTFDGNTIQVTQNGRLLVIGETQYDELTNYTITGTNGNYEVVVA